MIALFLQIVATSLLVGFLWLLGLNTYMGRLYLMFPKLNYLKVYPKVYSTIPKILPTICYAINGFLLAYMAYLVLAHRGLWGI